MGAGIAGIGQGLQAGIQGYNEGKATAFAERAKEVARLHDQADRLSQDIGKYDENDPMRPVLWRAYSETREKADKLSGEKGQGAWKAVRPILGMIIPELRDEKDGGHAKDVPTMVGPQQSVPVPGTSGLMGPPPSSGAPGPTAQPSIYQQMGANPPAGPTQLGERAANALSGFLGKYKTWDEFNGDPEAVHNFAMASLSAAKLGINPGQMLEAKFKRNEPMIHLDESNPLYKAIGATKPFDVPISQALEYKKLIPNAKENLEETWAGLVQGHSAGSLSPTQEHQYTSMKQIMKPESVTEVEAILGDTQPGTQAAADKLISYHKQVTAAQRQADPNSGIVSQLQVDQSSGQAYNFVYDKNTHKSSVEPYTDKNGKPVFLSKGAGASSYLISKMGVNGQPTTALNMNAIYRNLSNGTLSPEDASDFVDLAGPDYVRNPGQLGEVRNDNKNTLIRWITQAKEGKLEQFTLPTEIPANKTVAPGTRVPGFFQNFFGNSGASQSDIPQIPGAFTDTQ